MKSAEFETTWRPVETEEDKEEIKNVVNQTGKYDPNRFNTEERLLGSRVTEILSKGINALPKDNPVLNTIGSGLGYIAENYTHKDLIKAEEAIIDKVGEIAPSIGVDKTFLQLSAGFLIPGGGEMKTVKRTIKSARNLSLLSDTVDDIIRNDPAIRIRQLDELKEIEKVKEAARKAELIESGVLKPHPKGLENRLKTSAEAIDYYGLSHEELRGLGFRYNQYGSTRKGNVKLKSTKLNQIEIDKRNLSIVNVTDSEDMVKVGNRKWNAINDKGMEAHHIIPIHVSTKLKELYLFKDKAKGIVRKNGLKYWNQRKARDAKLGIFHGNDPRNIVAVRGSKKVPTTTAGKGSEMYHREGFPEFDNPGYHKIEGSINWGTSVPNEIDLTPYRDIMSNQQKLMRKADKVIQDVQGKSRQITSAPN